MVGASEQRTGHGDARQADEAGDHRELDSRRDEPLVNAQSPSSPAPT